MIQGCFLLILSFWCWFRNCNVVLGLLILSDWLICFKSSNQIKCNTLEIFPGWSHKFAVFNDKIYKKGCHICLPRILWSVLTNKQILLKKNSCTDLKPNYTRWPSNFICCSSNHIFLNRTLWAKCFYDTTLLLNKNESSNSFIYIS